MAAENIQAGTVIDGFLLVEKLHQGGMATLWRVTRDDIAFPMVMKIPRIRYGDDPAAIVGFEVEQMVLPKLSGLHVPRFVAARDFTSQPYIVMEYIEGVLLRDILETAPIDFHEVRRIGALIADALHDLHRQFTIHLDLKPANIIFRRSGEAVLVDFGLAHHDQLPDLLAEEFRLPMGTAPYISPEQILYVRRDPRSDIFALGVMMYHLITGERPFGNPTSVPGLRRRLYRDPTPPRAINSSCPRWLQEVILRCLEVDPAERYGSAAQLAFDLKDPSQILLTARAERGSRASLLTVARRWFRSIDLEPCITQSVAQRLESVPIIMAAVDVSVGAEALAEALRHVVRQTLEAGQGARLSCVTVRKVPRVGMDMNVDEEGRNIHVQKLVELKHWARPLELPPERIAFHVLEGPDPALTLVEYARSNHVDHIVIGARASSTIRRFLGSVSSQVVAEAPCTVTVVRIPHGSEAADTSADLAIT